MMRTFKLRSKNSGQFCAVVDKIMKDNNFQDRMIHRFSDKPFLFVDLDHPQTSQRILFINEESSFVADNAPEITAEDFLDGRHDGNPDNINPHRDLMLWWADSTANHVEVRYGGNLWMSASNPSWLPQDEFRRKPEEDVGERPNAKFIRARAHNRHHEIQILDDGVWVDVPADDRIYSTGHYRFPDPLDAEVDRILANTKLVARLKGLI